VARLVLDTNALLLFVIGTVDRTLLGRAKRVKQFVPDDHDLVFTYLSLFEQIHVTPHTATETSNLLSHLPGERRRDCLGLLAHLCRDEIHVASVVAAEREEFLELGLTDSALLSLCAEGIALLTEDEPLFAAAAAQGFDVQRFSDLRA
jgi:hypothetical protein